MQPKKVASVEKASLDRRSFLRLCAVTAGGAVVAACQQRLQNVNPTATASLALEPAVKIDVAGGDQDAWAWVKQVKVGVSEGECESVIVHANGQEFAARPEEDSFVAQVQLAEGENQVSATCLQPGGAEVQSEPVIYTGRFRQVPTAIIQIAIEDGQIVLDGSESVPAEGIKAAIADYVWSVREGNPAALRVRGGELTGDVRGEMLSVLPPTTDGEYYLSLRVVDEAGREDIGTSYFVVENGQPRIPDYDTENPAWLETAVVYGVIPFLFGNPAFQAIGERLDELADLGINAIWLGPINTHPVDDYGYAVENYFGLDPAYGTEEDFRNLVQTAHTRGIRVLMDFVPNHTSNTHPYFLDAQERGTESPYWDFYDRDEQGNYTYYFEWTHLPNLNYDNPEVCRMITEAFEYWVREFDVDGFRVDVVWGVKERRPNFWLEWRRALKRIKPDLMLLAEATAREPYYFDNGFDVAYDWTYRPGGWSWEIVWNAYKYRLLSYNLTEALTNSPEGYHPDAVIFRFLNNNDTGKRFITRHGEGVTRVATAMLLTLPGIPCLYTGDEYGLEFEPYQQLELLEFKEQFSGLRDYHKRLIELRKELASLHSPFWELIQPDAIPQSVFSYVRYSEESETNAPPVIVLLNFSEEPAEFQFAVPEQFGALADTLYDLLARESVPATDGNRMHVSVPALTARVLSKEPLA
ncbi:MAG TPA: alpha-amylase family glycosyl hydrolase [Anaerolineales bacterium]|nr:alpha-amylase family glycosyl hydrolase [Anaerolineales bacterium]